MNIAVASTAVAGMSALGAYLNAKYHIGQDLRARKRKQEAMNWYQNLTKQNRLSLWYAFANQADKYPDHLCIWSREQMYSWKETHDRAVQWAQFFLSNGVQPGDMVATYLMNSADFLVIWLALWCIGCAPAMLNYHLKGASLIHCLKISGVKVVLVDPDKECQKRIEGSRQEIEEELAITAFCINDELKKKVETSSVVVPNDSYRDSVTGPSPTCLLYTSGTTGLPKAGMYTVARFHERGNPNNLSYYQKPGPGGDRWYCSMPLFHGTGGLSCVGALTSGMSVAVGRKFSVSNFWNDIHDSEATFFVYVGEAARYLLMAPPHPLDRKHPRLRAMYGNGMRPDVWAKFKDRFDVPEVIEFFNSTEGVFGLVVHSTGPFTANAVGHHGALLRRTFHDVYVPVAIDPESGAVLRDPNTGLAKRNSYNEGGEILVGIPNESIFAGYYNNPEATAKKFERDVFKKGDLFFRTGDALRRDDDGRWFFLDRLGDTFRWKSENVSTAEVSQILGRFPGIAEANVYGVLVPNHDGRAGCVALRLEEDLSHFDFNAFLIYARDRLPKYAVPVFIRLVAQSSKTDNNKQNKAPLREEGIEIERFGEQVSGGHEDTVLWIHPGNDQYEKFDRVSLESLKTGRVLL
ncbi:acetyl-CoA synthetase-like protein [Lindgomyces ingoldianus]|uniref:Acetyl-CoA synthetase-like protein n=1 Tax=Lindgomyces ingoldianus TaxID=673940 RepID=A0ACB6R5F4_9PLEO|nr:acetyl-CoA synthetase-like protein [Lindgomyces ingoldianus]KAF2474302.1 acetyl-CoA synthetase-like protein [Lindgomyces ingoldianus]